jgi:hypothetical protein
MEVTYPEWTYFPRNARPPAWALDLVSVVGAQVSKIDSTPVPFAGSEALTSDVVLGYLRPGMQELGYTVEGGKKAEDKIRRPVLFGENGLAEVSYEIDAFHDDLGIAVEVEAGRGAMSNAAYRDIIRASLLLDARFMVLMMPSTYRYGTASRARAYLNSRDLLAAIYASRRIELPFEGVLLIGY